MAESRYVDAVSAGNIKDGFTSLKGEFVPIHDQNSGVAHDRL
jgi:hypothetical protein